MHRRHQLACRAWRTYNGILLWVKVFVELLWLAWLSALHATSPETFIAIDGKAVREAMARSSDTGPLCLVSAWASANQIVLGQVAGPPGSNELGALPKLLELLELKGAVVTLDALG